MGIKRQHKIAYNKRVTFTISIKQTALVALHLSFQNHAQKLDPLTDVVYLQEVDDKDGIYTGESYLYIKGKFTGTLSCENNSAIPDIEYEFLPTNDGDTVINL